MKLGLYFDLRDPPPWRRGWGSVYAQALETAEHADAGGIRSLWLSEHHFFEDGYLPQPLVFAAALAARTKRARIGTAVLIAPLRSALEIAEEAAVADVVSAGRLELGLGSGYRDRGVARAAGPLTLVLADDPDRAWAEIKPHAVYGWRTYDEYAREGRTGMTRPPTLPGVFDSIEGGAKPPVQVVTVEEAIAQLRAIDASATVEHVFFWERVAGMPDDLAARHVELIVDQLIPAVGTFDRAESHV